MTTATDDGAEATEPDDAGLGTDRVPAAPNYDGAFDAVVVGAGLAGSAAAITMAREGLDVAMIERGTSPGAKNVFGGVLYTPTVRELVDLDDAPLERYVGEKRFGMLSPDDETAVTLRPGEWREEPHNDSYTVLRGEFDEWFAEQAVEAGATLVTETTVTDLLRDGTGTVVGVDTDRPDGELRAPMVVLAEGGNSLVGERAGLKETADRENVAVAVKEVLEFPDREDAIPERFRLADDAGAAYHYFGEGAVGDAFGGAFIYTNDDTLSVGLAYRIEDAVTGQPKPERTLNRFKSHPAVAPLVRGGRTVEYAAKTIPEGGAEAMPDLVHDGAVVVGDAAGLVLNNGVHLEGTNMAVESGYHAGRTVASALESDRTDAGALRSYPRKLDESFVVRNLEHYEWLMAAAREDKDLLFGELPEAIADAGEEYFSIDRRPKADHAADAKERLLGTVGGWRGAAKLAWRYRKVIA
ncbi:FAD-dependent oxidoreductase [Halostella litorea]|uniref:FAD-dependent oxidoreductase n=1 Tax=Halostella litorea TaxID=2528831 RepID=UPI0010920999|nr:FAD-dependent oxidoreductase [Halostella litorea]